MPNGVSKTLKDRIILQKWRERDIAESGQSNIPDQEIMWDNKGEAQEAELGRDASHEWRHPQRPPRPLPREPNPQGNRWEEMDHLHLLHLEEEAEGVTIAQMRDPSILHLYDMEDQDIKPYNGDLSMEVLWDWLKSLVIHLETQQLGKAKKWYHDHIIEVDSNKTWTFTSVILALYDRFIHDSMMQEARCKFEKATFAKGGGTVEGFQDLLESYIRNMTMKPNDYTIQKLFMKRIPHAIRNVILEDHLHMELNMLDELVLSGKAWEDTEQSKREYAGKDASTLHRSGEWASGHRDQPKPFSGMRMFLHPKGNQHSRDNHHDPDRP
ncbi:hypothetical protein ARMGADRAFT_1035977 [Armillaria gallica]|uniref:Uncharacterized protein n=1 Tax=Armillaria gallica TaxID=47427 RepID=A0A2H3CSI3_ARMGA|nr:hypothetical protein ARMGADRAFT_1035977 [Armillaria gallica]